MGINTVFFGMPYISRENLARFIDIARFCFRTVIIIPNLGGVTTSAVAARDLGGIIGVEIVENLLNPWSLRMKRALDLLATLVGGTLILPFLLVISLLIWADSGRPIFYCAERMGKDGKHFLCLKFRTMRPDAEPELQRMLEADPLVREEYLKYHKLRNDPRVTRVGRLLRKLSLDELPQLWNVLRGDMSLVGPRPYLPRESEKIGGAQRDILRVPPGITGPWQVAGRNDILFQERVQIDANYIRNWSMWVDLVLLTRTLEVLLFKRSAY